MTVDPQGVGFAFSLSSGGMTESITDRVHSLARAAREAATNIARLSTPEKNAVLRAAADTLLLHTDEILAANAEDVACARKSGVSEALIDRLSVDPRRIESIAGGLRQVADLPDPVGEITRGHRLDSGLVITQVRVPLGVIGMVYEARPNVTVDAFALCMKSGNTVLLRGSASAHRTNQALVEILRGVLGERGITPDAVQLLPSDTHDSVTALITARGLVDVVIPRGGAGLITAVVTRATVPTIETGTGNCHLYIDASADLSEAISLLINGKTRRCSVCNATETVLFDAALADADISRVLLALQQAGVTVHGDERTRAVREGVEPVAEDDYSREYLSLDIAAAVVDGVDGAIAHIRTYSSHHTEAVAARDVRVTERFAREVDSAAVMINASTAFTDGEQFGFGAEIGISTQKLHARGPVGLPELTSSKWVVRGEGHTRP